MGRTNMKLRRILALGLILGMVAGSLSVADAAKKKRKIVKYLPTETSFFLRRDDCGGDADNPHLSIIDDVDGGTGCGSAFAGAPEEFFINADGAPFAPTVFPATDGVPKLIDASRDIEGAITVQSFQGDANNPGGLSAGQASLEILITGTVGGEVVTVGSATAEYLVTPDSNTYVVEFTADVDDALNKKKLTTLDLTLVQRGVTALHGFYELDDPASFFILPTLKKKVIFK
jgi:hypothetical protein